MHKDNINKRISGIYKIMNLINNKFYIGSAVSLLSRYHTHKNSFVKNKHNNKHLQSSVNKYGIENFKFEVIELCEKENLLIREQYYIDTLKPDYNICLTAGNSLGVKRSEEYKDKQRLIQTGLKHIPHSEETKKKIGIAHKGMKHSNKTKEIIREKNKSFKPTEEQKLKNSIAHKNHFRENGSSKLTYNQVLEIKELFNSKIKLQEIADRYNISLSTVKAIKYKRNWK